ncbi:unnamed protein product [Citrullus colocynthis]|uniref:Transmembrane protein n=1 Tax=Citrullus colocynthis TaxID=252529 RepID=A0ABP0YWU0_9ROSI
MTCKPYNLGKVLEDLEKDLVAVATFGFFFLFSLSYISLSSGVLSLCFFIIVDVKRALQFRSPIKASAGGVAFRRRRRSFLPHKLSYFFIVLLEFRESSVCSAKEG